VGGAGGCGTGTTRLLVNVKTGRKRENDFQNPIPSKNKKKKKKKKTWRAPAWGDTHGETLGNVLRRGHWRPVAQSRVLEGPRDQLFAGCYFTAPEEDDLCCRRRNKGGSTTVSCHRGSGVYDGVAKL